MQSLGEVTTLFPIHGGFIEHMGRFVDPALSFAVAWLYYFMWSVFLAAGWSITSFYAFLLRLIFCRLELSSPYPSILDS